MRDVNEMLAEQQRELERIRKKRGGQIDKMKWRKWLNCAFLALTCVGAALYFAMGEQHSGMAVWTVAILVKIIEFYIRFMY